MFILDNLATGTKLFTYLFSFVTVLYIKRYVADKKFQTGEFYAIFLFSVLGMMVMISADNMLVLYVGLELFSLALYGLIAYITAFSCFKNNKHNGGCQKIINLMK